jgi:hypothetical protein
MDIERCWREAVDVPPPRLEEGSVLKMIEAQGDALRRSLRQRLRREALYYVPLLAVAGTALLGGLTARRVFAAAVVAALLGVVIATLWRAERRLQEAPLDRSLRETLARLMSDLDAAGRAYLAAYVLVFVAAGSALTGFVFWQYGPGLPLAGAVAGSIAAVLWSGRSGRAYVERLFRGQRAELADLLGQLQEA